MSPCTRRSSGCTDCAERDAPLACCQGELVHDVVQELPDGKHLRTCGDLAGFQLRGFEQLLDQQRDAPSLPHRHVHVFAPLLFIEWCLRHLQRLEMRQERRDGCLEVVGQVREHLAPGGIDRLQLRHLRLDARREVLEHGLETVDLVTVAPLFGRSAGTAGQSLEARHGLVEHAESPRQQSQHEQAQRDRQYGREHDDADPFAYGEGTAQPGGTRSFLGSAQDQVEVIAGTVADMEAGRGEHGTARGLPRIVTHDRRRMPGEEFRDGFDVDGAAPPLRIRHGRSDDPALQVHQVDIDGRVCRCQLADALVQGHRIQLPVGQEEIGSDVLAREVAIDRLVEFKMELVVRDTQHVDERRRHDDAEQQEDQQQAPEQRPRQAHVPWTCSVENL